MAIKLLPNINGAKGPAQVNFPKKLIAETLTNGFFKVDHKWTIKYWNQAAAKILGVRADEMLGKNLWEKFASSLPPAFYDTYHKAKLQDIPAHFIEYWEERKTWFDVITYHLDNTLSVSFKTSAHPQHAQPPGHPEQKQNVLNELYRFVTEVSNYCLWEWDLVAKVFFWIDGGHKRVFGYRAEDVLIPQSFWESLIHPDDKLRIMASLNKVLNSESGADWEEDYRFKRADGTYAYVHERARIFFEGKGRASRMIGSTKDISTRKLAEIQLLEERLTRQKEITYAVIKAQENERAHIGKELHDNMNQILGAAKLYVEMARTDDENREMCLGKSSSYILQVIDEIRRLSMRLVTPGMRFIGVVESIRGLVADLVALHAIAVEFHEKGIVEEELDEDIQLNIYRIVQEQTNNILKHASAKHATIHLTKRAKRITLVIADDGKGCDLTGAGGGVGVMHIRSRAERLQGKATIESRPGEGYVLKVILPLGGYRL